MSEFRNQSPRHHAQPKEHPATMSIVKARLYVPLLCCASVVAVLCTCGISEPSGTTAPPDGRSITGTWIATGVEVRRGTDLGATLSFVQFSTSDAPGVLVIGGGSVTTYTNEDSITNARTEAYEYGADSTLSYGATFVRAWSEGGQLVMHEVVSTDSGSNVVITRYSAYSGSIPPFTWPRLTTQRADQYESDNSYLDATPITPNGASQEHSFYPVGDEDWYSFNAVTGATYTVFTNAGFTRDVRLYESNGSLSVANVRTTDSTVIWNCSATGTYYIWATKLGVDTLVWYTVKVTGVGIPTVDPDPAEYDDAASNAQSIAVDGEVSRTVSPVGDVDWLTFEAEAGLSYVIETTGQLDTRILLYSDRGYTLVAQADVGGAGGNARVVWQCTSTRAYYFKVDEKNANITGSYTVVLGLIGSSSTDAFEDDDVLGSARRIVVNAPAQCHQTDPTGDYDYVRVPLHVGTTYRIRTHGQLDTYISLIRTDGTEIATAEGVNATLTWTCDYSDTFYARVNEFGNNATGSYTVDVVTQ